MGKLTIKRCRKEAIEWVKELEYDDMSSKLAKKIRDFYNLSDGDLE